jgi:hypothetical protein
MDVKLSKEDIDVLAKVIQDILADWLAKAIQDILAVLVQIASRHSEVKIMRGESKESGII